MHWTRNSRGQLSECSDRLTRVGMSTENIGYRVHKCSLAEGTCKGLFSIGHDQVVVVLLLLRGIIILAEGWEGLVRMIYFPHSLPKQTVLRVATPSDDSLGLGYTFQLGFQNDNAFLLRY